MILNPFQLHQVVSTIVRWLHVRRRWHVCVAAAALIVLIGPSASAATTLAGWDVHGQPGGLNFFGPTTLPATISGAHVTVGDLTRGGGVGTGGGNTGAARGWGGNNWVVTSETDAITANKFATFTVTTDPGYSVSYSNISRFDYRRSGTGASTGILQYAIGSGSFVDGPSLNYSSTSSSGASLGSIDLSSIAALQNVAPNTTVTFRIVNWGGTSSAGTWYVFDTANSTANDLEVQGTVVPVTSVGVETAANGSGSVVSAQTVSNGQSITVYAVWRDGSNGFVANAASNWSLASITGGVVAGDLVPAGDGKSAVFTAHQAGTAIIHAAVSGLTSTDSGVITAQGALQNQNPTASALATPPTVTFNQQELLEVAVVLGMNPTSTAIAVTGDLSSIGGSASTTFHDYGLNGDKVAGDNIFSYQLTITPSAGFGDRTISFSVSDAQSRTASTSVSLHVLGDLRILHMNDTHARITPHKWIVPSHAPVSSTFEDVGGAAYLASAVLQGTASDPSALVLDGGDISEGNPIGDIGGNLSMTNFYNMLDMKLKDQRGRGIDAIVVGNHDVRDASYIMNLDSLVNNHVAVISANVRDLPAHTPHFAPYTILTVNGVKIGILGYTTQAAAVGASLSNTLEVADCDWFSTDATKIHLADYVNELRNTKSCDMVILLTHMGHSGLATDTTIDGVPSAALLADTADAKVPEIAVTGHWHTWAETVWQPDSLHYKTIFTEAGSYMHYLGELLVDGRGKYQSSIMHPLRNSAYAPDPDVQSYVDGLIATFDADTSNHPAFNQVIGYTNDDLLLDERMKWWSSDEYPWSGNDTAGQWIADGVRWKCEQIWGQCDLAWEVGGGVRSDIPAGPMTYAQAYETFPWSDDTFTRINMTGQEIINFLKVTNCDAAFSSALHVVAHDGVPVTVTFNGAPIDVNHVYKVGITNYIYDHPPAGWTWSDLAPENNPLLARDGLIEFMQTAHPTIGTAYSVGGRRYDLDTMYAGIYRAVVTMMNDNDTKPAFEDGFMRFLSATPETLARRGTVPVPVSLVNADGSINQAHRLAENEVYRSYLGFKTNALSPGDIVEVSGKGGFFGGDPEFVDQEGVYGDGVEFKIVGHDASLAKPTFMPSIASFFEDNHKNHYVQFLAKKASSTTVTDQVGTTLKLWDKTGFANQTIPGNTNDLLLVSGITTSESYSLRFRCDTVVLASPQGIANYPAASTVSSHVDPIAPEGLTGSLTLTATTGANTSARTLVPVADAEVASFGTNADTNFGTSNNIFLQSTTAGPFGNERGWLRFDLSSLPADSVITAADLELFNWKSTGASLATEVHGGDTDDWLESGSPPLQPPFPITWNRQPTFGPTLSMQTLAAGNTDVTYAWDVTGFVQSKWAGNKLVSLVVKAAIEDSTATPIPSYGFDTKEFGSNAPILRVTTQSNTGGTVAQVEFFYRYSADGTTWGSWTSAGVDTTAPYSVAFTYSQGNGFYEFYSVATDNLGATEGAPPTAQAFVHRETSPGYPTVAYVTISNLSQTYNGAGHAATVTTVPPALNVDVTYDGSPVLPVHPGTYAVSATVNQPEYTGNATDSLVIAQSTQTINFPPLGSVQLGASPFTLSATSSSGLPVTYQSSDPSVATIAGNVLTVVGHGTTNITASAAGNQDFLAAVPVAQSLCVGVPETCNGQDDDCDGVIDNGLPLASCGVGACARTGSTCSPASCTPGTPTAETCNGIDDDCNGVIDNGVPLATCGVGACARTGSTCSPASCTPGAPTAETCNGIDDDCNGVVDNGVCGVAAVPAMPPAALWGMCGMLAGLGAWLSARRQRDPRARPL
jgi:2',3'-cyclic-nucleotide 2'-phosphodiesterase (5'-nucleotidase family)